MKVRTGATTYNCQSPFINIDEVTVLGLFQKYFLPNRYTKSIQYITPEELKAQGIKAIITDLDNTLVGFDVSHATDEVIDWTKRMQEAGIMITIVSNNKHGRVSTFSTPLEIDFIFAAKKPMGRAFRRAIRKMNVRPDETVVIGDQLMTDVFGANRIGVYSILVIPVKNKDEWKTKFNRFMEKRILAYFKRKGLISWEE